MPREGYNYNFKMFLEGIEVPFQSANIICTPNGVEASINLHANEKLLELKPKTAVQIFFKEWIGDKPGWKLLCDGFYSRFDKNEDASGGIGVAIQVRDFRMDIRKAPAALAYSDAGNIEGATYYHCAGVFKKVHYKTNTSKFDYETRTFDNSRINDLWQRLVMIASSAAGALEKDGSKLKSGDPNKGAAKSLTNATDKGSIPNRKLDGHAAGGFFLDAVARGIWMDSAGGTKLGTFLNKRIRADKRLLIPVNRAGYNMFKVQKLSDIGAEAAMADSQFSSIEAVIMRIAALFMVRIYSCNTPSLISLDDNENGKPNLALEYIIDEDVRNFLVKKSSKEFGPKYMLNSSMLLPALEFTAPPTCNLIFPCMYHRVVWQYDIDAEITRGYFTASNFLTTSTTPLDQKWNYQVPNGLFHMPKKDDKGNQIGDLPEYRTSPLTLEERYKGVNVMMGTVESEIAYRQLSTVAPFEFLTKEEADKIQAKWNANKQKANDASDTSTGNAALKKKLVDGSVSAPDAAAAKKEAAEKQIVAKSKKSAKEIKDIMNLAEVLRHHAVLKFLNTRYAGRVVTVEMSFNPYLICGFPATIIADEHGDGFKTLKTMIGMLQQVKHFITRDGDAVTSCVINNIRYIDEATDIDEAGNPLFLSQMSENDKSEAQIDPDTLKYITDSYTVPNAKPKIRAVTTDSKLLDVEVSDVSYGHPLYAKDLLCISRDDVSNGKVNGVYLDDIYSPNKISAFYKAVLKQENHFMVGTATEETGGSTTEYSFMYSSIHEAIDNLQTNPLLKSKLSNYEEAMNYIKRDICCEEAFYCGILGLSIDNSTANDIDLKYIKKETDFDPTITRNEYFGVSSPEWKAMSTDPEKMELIDKTILKDGMMSSITESQPMTAFIEERKVSVKAYRDSVAQQAEAVRLQT